ncbi:glycoside hydrolase family 25 protein [Novosphingobium sp. PS1R-30]|uniref:Glycoside hydrolase family 25 protein n=1 Tax=Novosphingobium anseongense TaxID=3133436 RepID=A0ABU8RZD3_9SPHN|nr:MAG: lysozyme [Novosphingobium sp.]
MARKASSRTQLRVLGALILIALVGGLYGWWHLHHWRPERSIYRVQGVEIGVDDGEVDWRAIKAIGADFVYIDASASAFARDPAFTRNLTGARGAKLQVGALHRYDPCQPADRQAANFVTVVPRDPTMLPPAVELDRLADDCPVKVSDAAIQSELTTFLNQVETHTGKPSLLKLTERFETRYQVANTIDRNVWLVRNRFQPDYAGRPWALWTANDAFSNEASGADLRWVVLQP